MSLTQGEQAVWSSPLHRFSRQERGTHRGKHFGMSPRSGVRASPSGDEGLATLGA